MRWLLVLFSVVLITLIVATCLLWHRSYDVKDTWHFGPAGPDIADRGQVSSSRGVVFITPSMEQEAEPIGRPYWEFSHATVVALLTLLQASVIILAVKRWYTARRRAGGTRGTAAERV